MKLKCVIIDDEPVARKILREFIEDVEFLEFIGQAENPLKAMPILKEQEPDIIFLDINMPKINGIEFLRSAKWNASIILTTAYGEYAVDAFGLAVLDYLLKPISFERFLMACNKALKLKNGSSILSQQSKPTEDHFFIKCNHQIEKIYFDELIYAEAMLNYVMLYTTSKSLMVYLTIKNLEAQLPPERFIKVHKSFIVNINKVVSIEGSVLDLGTKKISMSQSLKDKVIETIVKDKMIKR